MRPATRDDRWNGIALDRFWVDVWHETRYDRIFSPEDDLAAVVPIHTLDALERYIRDRLPPGGFLTAVLSNDLVGAFGAADSTNVEAMKEIIVFIYNRIPSSSWGSKEKVNAWIANREEA